MSPYEQTDSNADEFLITLGEFASEVKGDPSGRQFIAQSNFPLRDYFGQSTGLFFVLAGEETELALARIHERSGYVFVEVVFVIVTVRRRGGPNQFAVLTKRDGKRLTRVKIGLV